MFTMPARFATHINQLLRTSTGNISIANPIAENRNVVAQLSACPRGVGDTDVCHVSLNRKSALFAPH